MKAQRERVCSILLDTIAMLCKNSVEFKRELKVQGLIGVTIDDDEVFLVQINETCAAAGVVREVKNELKGNDSDDLRKSLPVLPHQPWRKNDRHTEASYSSSEERYESSVGHSSHNVLGNRYSSVKIEKTTSDYRESQNEFPIIDSNQVTHSISQVPACVSSTDTGGRDEELDCYFDEEQNQPEDGDQLNDEQIWESQPAAEDTEYSYGHDRLDISSHQRALSTFRGQQINRVHQRDMIQGGARGTTPRRRGALPGGVRGNTTRSTVSHTYSSRGDVGAASRRGGNNNYVITESSHMCGYPDCGKRFKFKHDLLRHQTKKHGRAPVCRSVRYARQSLDSSQVAVHGEDFSGQNDSGGYTDGY